MNKREPQAVEDPREKVVLVGLARSASEVPAAEASLDELEQLAHTAGAETVARVVQVRERPDAATYIGKGKAKEVVEQARMLSAGAIIFDDELAPAQGRNLEDVAAVNPLAPNALKIIDRTGLILDVFAQHASSAEGKLQVELAQINYLIPRLRGWGEVLSRIGGAAAAGGARAPIGTRGPGETQLEMDRRRIQRRLRKLKADLEDLERARAIKRKGRFRTGVKQVSMVGYTNAGKSTLLNALTGAGVLVEDKLFSTLDPTARRLKLVEGPDAILIDTVGFVKKLPHQLVEAFRSTLEETIHADLLVHVVDASQAEPEEHVAAVESVLREIDAHRVPQVLALNKTDLIDQDRRDELAKMFSGGIFLSAVTGEGIDDLLRAVKSRLDAGYTVMTLKIPYERSEVRAQLYQESQVLEELPSEDGVTMTVRVPPSEAERLSEFAEVER